jgi:hypothetical protein
MVFNGSFTLAKFVSETISDSDMKQYLPWSPWAMPHRYDRFYLCRYAQGGQSSDCCMLLSLVAVASIVALTFANGNMA